MAQSAMTLSVCIITCNEEANLGRTLESVSALVKESKGEIIVVDSGSTDRTVEIAKSCGAKVFSEPWKGYAAQKNSTIAKATGGWVLLLDADEAISRELAAEIPRAMGPNVSGPAGYWIPRRNLFLGRWIKHGGFYPDRKLRLFRKGAGRVEDRLVHETIQLEGPAGILKGDLLHSAYPTLTGYIEHMNKYSSLGAQMAAQKSRRGFSLINIVIRPWLTFFYNYFLRLGFLDGEEGLLLHFYHAVYVSWKYAKVWEISKKDDSPQRRGEAE
jgi:glycosyltransferase involved in cell wall biosynthesis